MKPALPIRAVAFMVLTALFVSCREEAETEPDTTPTSTDAPAVRTENVLTGYEIIWGMDFLPTGDLLFTEKRGRIFRFANGTATELMGLPTDIDARGQGGLLDLRVHPNYASNGWVYVAYSSSSAGSGATRLNLIRFKINGNQITELSNIFRTVATNTWQGHYGGRIEFDRNGLVYLSVGEGGPSSYGGATSPNQNAQTLSNEWGKIHRLTESGGVPADNPVLPGRTGPTTIYSYGHRNPQGLALNPATGDLWATEHGPRGGDELNIIQAGRNYGWPLVSNGVNYNGQPVADSPTREGIQAPIYTWTPSMGPSGLAFVTSDAFKNWKGDLFAGALALTYLSRLDIDGNRVVGEERLMNQQGRVRNVKQGPDGNLYMSIEGPGRIVRLVPE
ncbi:PQQ-dependent sugar dehydrogenase [Fibrisoma limi]|nr:PQQ-dependent sugar dehydrogenase [Fibrisoma limi]